MPLWTASCNYGDHRSFRMAVSIIDQRVILVPAFDFRPADNDASCCPSILLPVLLLLLLRTLHQHLPCQRLPASGTTMDHRRTTAAVLPVPPNPRVMVPTRPSTEHPPRILTNNRVHRLSTGNKGPRKSTTPGFCVSRRNSATSAMTPDKSWALGWRRLCLARDSQGSSSVSATPRFGAWRPRPGRLGHLPPPPSWSAVCVCVSSRLPSRGEMVGGKNSIWA